MHNLNEISNKYLVNTLLKLEKTLALHFLELLHKKRVKMQPKRIYNKTPYVWSNKFTQAKKILQHRWL